MVGMDNGLAVLHETMKVLLRMLMAVKADMLPR